MRAVLVDSANDSVQVKEVEESLLDGAVELEVLYSSFNYKDGLAIEHTSRAKIVPLIPGIDIIGRVASSAAPEWGPGDLVVINGDGHGECKHGGFATRARVRPDSLVQLPESISPFRAAAIGTAGFTAMIAVLKLLDAGVTPESGKVIVTGSAGGVGSIAISLLATRGFHVVASTGRKEEQGDYLMSLGAKEVIDRAQFSQPASAPLQEMRWAAAVDTVGSHTLANVLSQVAYSGTVVACGVAQGVDLPATVIPFILRDVTLMGANSVDAPAELRQRAWTALAAELDFGMLDDMTATIGLIDTIPFAKDILAGQVRGRTVVDVQA